MTEAPSASVEFAALLARLRERRGVIGAVLTGSRARQGTAPPRSDYDVLLVTEDGAEADAAAELRRGARLDVWALPLSEFRAHALPGSGSEWNRYTFAHAVVLRDTPDGLLARLVSAKGRLTAEEAARAAPAALDAFCNGVYRSLKNDRDGDPCAARLDAAELAVPGFLSYVFACEQRVRPFNRYLRWELRHHPLSRPEWAAERLLPLLEETLTAASPAPGLRAMFNGLEPHARAAGHGPVLDGWGEDLLLMRGVPDRGAPSQAAPAGGQPHPALSGQPHGAGRCPSVAS